MRLRTKLLSAYLGLSTFLLGLGGAGALYLINRATHSHIEKDLELGTRAIIHLVETTAQGSIVNYLRAVAERNRDIVAHYQRTRDQATGQAQHEADIRATLLSQTIGRSGYLYCLDSRGRAVIHPNPAVEGSDLSAYDFVQRQLERKTGYLEYQWRNPGETVARSKALYMVYYEPLDWIISVSAYRDEFRDLLPMAEIAATVKALEYETGGYALVADRKGNVIIHPELEGENFFRLAGEETALFEKILAESFGRVTYEWRNPGEKQAREKFAYFGYVPEFEWFVGSTGYTDRLYAPLRRAARVTAAFLAAALVLSAVLTLFISGSIVRRLTHLTQVLADIGAKGHTADWTMRASPGPRDEIGALARMFNTFLERLQRYHRQLGAEIEEHRTTAEALRRSEAQFEATFNQTFQFIGILDLDGTIRRINQTALDFSGSRHGALKGLKLWEAPAWRQSDGQVRLRQAVEKAAAGESVRMELNQRRHDGERRTVDVSLKPVRDASGSAVLLVYEGRDIHERKKAEEVLRLSEEKYRVLVENAHEAIFIVQEGILRYANQSTERLFGDTTAEILGRSLSAYLHPEDRDMVMQRHQARLQGLEVPNFYSFRILDRGGATKWLELNAVRIHWQDQAAVMCFARDMTYQKQMETQLLQSQKMDAIGTLAGGIAHDFNNSLQAINGYTQLLQMEPALSARQRKMLSSVRHACNHAGELTQQLLTFSRKVESRLMPLDLNTELRTVIGLIQRTLPRMIEIDIRLSEHLRIVEADRTQLEQVIMNLCINAGHAMPDGGRLTLETKNADLDDSFCRHHLGAVPGTYSRLSVSDTGMGMDAQTREHIFEPFFTTRETGTGTGLGLAMVYGIVKAHKGYIACESAPGEGTRFDIYFPSAEGATDVPAAPTQRPERAAGGDEAILVVDDDRSVRRLTVEMLGRHGYRVTAVESGEAALATLRQPEGGAGVDLVVLDLNMPGMGGVRCLEEIHAMAPDLPVLIASGFLPKGEDKAVLDRLARGFVTKPYEIVTLLKNIRAALERAPS